VTAPPLQGDVAEAARTVKVLNAQAADLRSELDRLHGELAVANSDLDGAQAADGAVRLRDLREANQELVLSALASQVQQQHTTKEHQLKAQQRLDVAEADLLTERTASELREQFIAVLGHDLRTPLAAILAGTRVLQKLPVQDAALPVVAMMHRSIKRMTGLIDAVLDFARTQLGSGLGLQRQAVGSLEPVLQHVADELQAASPDRVIELHMDLNESVHCDPGRIGQLVSNLISNALTHGAVGSVVRISAVTARGVMELWVANGGDPIPPALLGKLFLPFVRSSVSSKLQGLGLGLFIAQEIASAHEGTLSVTSNQHETRFTFQMPCNGIRQEKLA
jgi:signal transduction histidine kinase